MERSTNEAFMNDLKKSVLNVTKGEDRKDRKYALTYLRKHVRLDDLHQKAVRSFPRRPIVFGQGHYAPSIVVLTKDPILEEAKQKLNRAWERMGINTDSIYYAHLRFAPTKKKQKQRQQILEELLTILNPKGILIFDSIVVKTKAQIIDVEIEIQNLLTPQTKEDTRKITRKMKETRRFL